MVFKRDGGATYYYKFFFKGDQIYKSTRQTNRRIAEQMEAAHKTALAKGEMGLLEKKAALSFSDLCERFLNSTGLRKRTTTGRFYKGMVRSLQRFEPLNKITIDQIDDALVDRYIEHRRNSTCLMVVRKAKGASEERTSDKPLGVAVVNRELSTLRRMLNLAKQWRLLDVVPHISLLPGETHRERVVSHAEEELYLAFAPELLRDFAIVSLNTALRPGEIQRLRWENIHFDPADDAEYGSIHNSDGGPKKRERNLSMTVKVREVLLARWKALGKPLEGWVFAGEKDTFVNYSTIDSQHDRTLGRMKNVVPFRLYDLRHTALTRLGESGADQWTIQRIAGHTDIRTTSRYVHPSPKHMENAFARLEAYNRRKGTKIQ